MPDSAYIAPQSRISRDDAIKAYGRCFTVMDFGGSLGPTRTIVVSEHLGVGKPGAFQKVDHAIDGAKAAMADKGYDAFNIEVLSLPRRIDLPIVLKKGDPVFLMTQSGFVVDKIARLQSTQNDGHMGEDLSQFGLTHLVTYETARGRLITPPKRRINPASPGDFAEIAIGSAPLNGQKRTVDLPLPRELDMTKERAFFSPQAAEIWAHAQAAQLAELRAAFERQLNLAILSGLDARAAAAEAGEPVFAPR